MKLKHEDWYGFNHEMVKEKFEGDLTFVNYMPLRDKKGNDFVAAVYKAKNPNREKGHKDYMLLFKQIVEIDPIKSQFFVGGMDKEEMEKNRFVSGIHCKECDTVLFSLNRHHFHRCGCPNDTFVDGGRDYLRFGALSLKKTRTVTIDLLTNKIKVDKKSTK